MGFSSPRHGASLALAAHLRLPPPWSQNRWQAACVMSARVILGSSTLNTLSVPLVPETHHTTQSIGQICCFNQRLQRAAFLRMIPGREWRNGVTIMVHTGTSEIHPGFSGRPVLTLAQHCIALVDQEGKTRPEGLGWRCCNIFYLLMRIIFYDDYYFILINVLIFEGRGVP